MSNLMNLLKAKHHPDQFKAEQAEADRKHQETLAFVEGMKAALESEQDIKKALFVSDPFSVSGFKPNK